MFCGRVCQWGPGEYVPLKPAGWKASTPHQGGKGCAHRNCLVPRTGWLTVCLASSRRHELSDCNWEISCFPVVWPGLDVGVLRKCIHSMPRKDLDWEGNFVAFLWEMKSCLFPSPMTRLVWDRIYLFLCTKRKVRPWSQETGNYLCPGLQSPVLQCVSTRCEREYTNSPPFSLGTWTVKWNWWWPLWPYVTDTYVSIVVVPL